MSKTTIVVAPVAGAVVLAVVVAQAAVDPRVSPERALVSALSGVGDADGHEQTGITVDLDLDPVLELGVAEGEIPPDEAERARELIALVDGALLEMVAPTATDEPMAFSLRGAVGGTDGIEARLVEERAYVRADVAGLADAFDLGDPEPLTRMVAAGNPEAAEALAAGSWIEVTGADVRNGELRRLLETADDVNADGEADGPVADLVDESTRDLLDRVEVAHAGTSDYGHRLEVRLATDELADWLGQWAGEYRDAVMHLGDEDEQPNAVGGPDGPDGDESPPAPENLADEMIESFTDEMIADIENAAADVPAFDIVTAVHVDRALLGADFSAVELDVGATTRSALSNEDVADRVTAGASDGLPAMDELVDAVGDSRAALVVTYDADAVPATAPEAAASIDSEALGDGLLGPGAGFVGTDPGEDPEPEFDEGDLEDLEELD